MRDAETSIVVVGSSRLGKASAQVAGPGIVPPKKVKATFAAYKAAGWVPLQEPDSRFVPGRIFRAVPPRLCTDFDLA